MLNAYTCDKIAIRRVASISEGSLRQAAWIDLVSATPDEVRLVQQATGLELPGESDLAEIESSSRLNAQDGVLRLSMPLVAQLDKIPSLVPGGFVLTRDRLITIRFAPSRVFDGFIERERHGGTGNSSSAHLFVGILEAIVDRQADALEHARAQLDAISHRIFRTRSMKLGGGKHEDRMLRSTLAGIGQLGDLISYVRDSQVTAGRIVPFVQAMAKDWLPAELAPRFTALTQDIASLNDFDTHLNDKLQFLLDATMGFINIAQNNVMKVLTVASVVGIPPVLIAGIYGMNFKGMPELDWHWGYAYGLIVITLSAVIPLAWFKLRDWI
ncbi:MAG TPA: magnesium transporter CorA family protein [Acetobacteraceae bacterium]|nr:magnesium transporter CorA family protein [Acetobacteraceae bacterium]